MFCKTIILSNSSNLSTNAPKGILTLSKENNHIKGKIRLYNLTSLPNTTKIGLYINQQVHTAQIFKRPNHYEFDLNENVDIEQSVYCALIDNATNDKTVLLEGGSFNGFSFTDSPSDVILEARDEELEQEINQAIYQSNSCENCDCSNCEYKKYFYNNYLSQDKNNETTDLTLDQPLSNTNDTLNNLKTSVNDTKLNALNPITAFQDQVISTLEDEVLKTLESPANHTGVPSFSDDNDKDLSNQQQTDFLNDIVCQLDEMLEKYPAENTLNSIIPNSRFVYVQGDKPYVVGIIYDNNLLKYIAYGVPATYNSTPPADLGQHYQWLPINPADVMSDGYFMIYQDALNGTIVEINFE